MPDLKSLAGRLFKLVFGWYLLLAILVTGIQLGLEYSSIRNTIASDLVALGRSFAPGVSDAMWTYDTTLLDSLARGVAQTAIVTGVKIENSRAQVVATHGRIPDEGRQDANTLLAPFQMHEVPLRSISLAEGRHPRTLGRMVLYSDRSVAVDRVKYSFLVILINSLVKTTGLWLIFHWVISLSLSRPLTELSKAVAKLDFEPDQDEPVLLEYPHRDEIGMLVAALNDMRIRLGERTAQLEAANKELEEFSYSMSHDMRSPLRAIDGFSQILLEKHGAVLDDESRRLLKVLRESAQLQGRLVDGLLQFLALGRRAMKPGSIDIAKLATEVFVGLQAAAPTRRMRLEAGMLPPAWGDRDMIRLALHNLLSNAVKYSPADTEARIEIAGTAGRLQNVYSVTDHGVGFDMRYADKLFKVFERIHPIEQYEGTGVGLAMVKRIIGRHGGKVWAEGRVGLGATFHFSLPQETPGPVQAQAGSGAERT
jgi:signal transduction histidine kinase